MESKYRNWFRSLLFALAGLALGAILYSPALSSTWDPRWMVPVMLLASFIELVAAITCIVKGKGTLVRPFGIGLAVFPGYLCGAAVMFVLVWVVVGIFSH